MERGISSLSTFVRDRDRDRYQTALFAPANHRAALFALYAFNYEIARVRETVTQPMLGQIRLQWWREVIEAAFGETRPRAHFVAGPLVSVIRDYRLDRAHLDRMIDIRERDLAEEPPATLTDLEEYGEGTASRLLYLALEVLQASAAQSRAAAREVGLGYALAGLIRAMPFHAVSGRCYIPSELALQAGLDPADYAARRATAGLRAATAVIAEAAGMHLQAARRLREEVPRTARCLLLSAIVADRFLGRLARTGSNPFAPQLVQPDTLQGWRLLTAALQGRY